MWSGGASGQQGPGAGSLPQTAHSTLACWLAPAALGCRGRSNVSVCCLAKFTNTWGQKKRGEGKWVYPERCSVLPTADLQSWGFLCCPGQASFPWEPPQQCPGQDWLSDPSAGPPGSLRRSQRTLVPDGVTKEGGSRSSHLTF
jgi:hypothetical protein